MPHTNRKTHKNKPKQRQQRATPQTNSGSNSGAMTQRANVGKGVSPKIYTFTMRSTPTSLTSDGAGVINSNHGVLGVNVANNFTELSAVFDLYRVKKYTWMFFPLVPNGSSSTADYAPLYCLYDADANAAPISTVATAVQYDTLRTFNVYMPIQYSVTPGKLSDGAVVQGGWINVGGPQSIGQFQAYGTGFDLSGTYGTYYQEFVVEFKNVR